MEKNWCYTIKEEGHPHNGETLWSGRYCAVAAFVFLKDGEDIFVLTNRRGKGTPDFQGMWNCPCGFLECNESAEEGCVRETKEETGVILNPSQFMFCGVETDPAVCNKGHVTLRYAACINKNELEFTTKLEGGEVDEVEAVKWINIQNIDKYQWAFQHNQRIKDIYNYIFTRNGSRKNI